MRIALPPTLIAALAASSLFVPVARAQQNPGFFVPPAAHAPAHHAPVRRPPARPAAPVNIPPPLKMPAATPPVSMSLPPVPKLPPLAKTQPPPAAVIGVLGVPEVMQASTAAKEVQKAIGQRREALNQDAQKEQAVWRELQQQLTNPHSGLSPEQIRIKERELQERITSAQRVFRERNTQIQQAGQFALAQIERTLVGVIRQVAESRSINLVLHRTQVALNTNEFDITQAVADQLNKVLPSVKIPPAGVTIVVPPEQPSPAAASGSATPGTAAAPASAQPPKAAAPHARK